MPTESHRADGLTEGTILHQSYQIEGQINSGGFGITYKARHINLGNPFVIKEFFPLDSALRAEGNTVHPRSQSDNETYQWGIGRFFEEAKLLNSFDHPNIAKVTDLFQANGTAYFVMPYIEGTTLHDWSKQHPQPTEAEILSILQPLLHGLYHVHNKKILHTEINPENVLITQEGTPILINFGEAKLSIDRLMSQRIDQAKLVPDEAKFWSSERYSGRAAREGSFTAALDFYSLSASIYYCITHSLPPKAPGRMLEDDYQPLATATQYKKKYSQELLIAIDTGLEVLARNRHQTAKAYLNALGEQDPEEN